MMKVLIELLKLCIVVSTIASVIFVFTVYVGWLHFFSMLYTDIDAYLIGSVFIVTCLIVGMVLSLLKLLAYINTRYEQYELSLPHMEVFYYPDNYHIELVWCEDGHEISYLTNCDVCEEDIDRIKQLASEEINKIRQLALLKEYNTQGLRNDY